MRFTHSRFVMSGIITVILLGLLIFFHAGTAVQFMRSEIVGFVSPALHSLMTVRIWAISSRENGDARAVIDQHERLVAAHAAVQELTQENNRLRLALGLKEKNKATINGAAVIFYGKELGREFLLIDRGIRDHVGKGDFVIDANGLLVGRVDDVGDGVGHVSIASNDGGVWDAQILPWGGSAFAKSLGGRAFSLELLPQHAVIRTGDYVMTKINAFSFPLAYVVRVDTSGTGTFKEVRAVLLSHPERMSEVFVVSSGKSQ